MGSHFSLPNLLFLVKITIHRKMDAHQATLRVCVALHSGPHRFFHDWLKWTLRKQASRLFSRNFRWPWIHYVRYFLCWSFFVNKKSLFWNWEGVLCCRFLFSGNRRVNIDQAITKYIIHIQPSLLTSLVLCSNFNLFTCTLYWQFFANFFVRV